LLNLGFGRRRRVADRNGGIKRTLRALPLALVSGRPYNALAELLLPNSGCMKIGKPTIMRL
jgi:hypothetical protein